MPWRSTVHARAASFLEPSVSHVASRTPRQAWLADIADSRQAWRAPRALDRGSPCIRRSIGNDASMIDLWLRHLLCQIVSERLAGRLVGADVS